MMINVTDRLERERIDHNNAEREIEAAERAEQEQIRAAWKSQTESDGTGAAVEPPPIERSGFVNRRVVKRKSSNFEMSFFEDEEEGTEQSHIDSIKQQKSLFEKQRLELQKLTQVTRVVGGSVYARLAAKDSALKWVEDLTVKYKKAQARAETSTNTASALAAAAEVLISEKKREQIKMKLPTVNVKKAKKKHASINLD